MVKEKSQTVTEIIGNPDGKVHYSAEELAALRAKISERVKNQTPAQKRKNEMLGIHAEITTYIDSQAKNDHVLDSGHFIKKVLDIYDVPQQKLAGYLGLNKSNFSALMNGNRKINFDIALKLAHIFGIKAELWLQIQNKNELHRLRQANRKEYEKYTLSGLLEQ